jgi:hypothetical protein
MVLTRMFNKLVHSTITQHFIFSLIFANKAELGQQGELPSIERVKIFCRMIHMKITFFIIKKV